MSAGDRDLRDRVWSTDKAEFVQRGDRLLKRYTARGVASRDVALLETIATHFEPRRLDGWTYRATHVYGADEANNALTMEFVAGVDVKDLFHQTQAPQVFRHAGRWLGYLHDSSPGTPAEVITFNDYNCSNVVVDHAGREVVALDPGGFTDLVTHPGVSLAVGVLSAGRVSMRSDPRSVMRCIRAYLSGYLEATEEHRLPPLWRGWSYVLQRIHVGKTHAFITRGPAVAQLAAGAIEVTGWAAITALLSRLVQRDVRRRGPKVTTNTSTVAAASTSQAVSPKGLR